MAQFETETLILEVPQGSEMIEAMRQGVVEALRDHKLAGRSIVAWDRQNQQIVEIPAESIVINESSYCPQSTPLTSPE